jgi:hypothetical protein
MVWRALVLAYDSGYGQRILEVEGYTVYWSVKVFMQGKTDPDLRCEKCYPSVPNGTPMLP